MFFTGFEKRASSVAFAIPRIEKRVSRWGQHIDDVMQSFPEAKELLNPKYNLNDPIKRKKFKTFVGFLSRVYKK